MHIRALLTRLGPAEVRTGHQISLEPELQRVVKQPCVFWEPNFGPPQEQQVLFLAKSSLQPRAFFFLHHFYGHFCVSSLGLSIILQLHVFPAVAEQGVASL